MLRFEKSNVCVDQTDIVLTLQNNCSFTGGDFHEIKRTILSHQISIRLQQKTDIGKLKATKSFDGIEGEGTCRGEMRCVRTGGAPQKNKTRRRKKNK